MVLFDVSLRAAFPYVYKDLCFYYHFSPSPVNISAHTHTHAHTYTYKGTFKVLVKAVVLTTSGLSVCLISMFPLKGHYLCSCVQIVFLLFASCNLCLQISGFIDSCFIHVLRLNEKKKTTCSFFSFLRHSTRVSQTRGSCISKAVDTRSVL